MSVRSHSCSQIYTCNQPVKATCNVFVSFVRISISTADSIELGQTFGVSLRQTPRRNDSDPQQIGAKRSGLHQHSAAAKRLIILTLTTSPRRLGSIPSPLHIGVSYLTGRSDIQVGLTYRWIRFLSEAPRCHQSPAEQRRLINPGKLMRTGTLRGIQGVRGQPPNLTPQMQKTMLRTMQGPRGSSPPPPPQ